MYYTIEKTTMNAQERREAMLRVTADFVKVLNGETRQWDGTMTDLMEVAHVAYECGTVRDEYGRVLTFTQLAHQACAALHLQPPRNLRQLAYRARNRKGVRKSPILG